MISHCFHGLANLCMGNTYKIHHFINCPMISFCRVTGSGQNTCLISFEKQQGSGIIIPDCWCLAPLACNERALTPIFTTLITALLLKEPTALLQ